MTVGKGVFVDIFYLSLFHQSPFYVQKSTKNSLQPDRRKNRLFLCFSALSGGNSAWIVTTFKPDRTCLSRAPELLRDRQKSSLMTIINRCSLFTWRVHTVHGLCSNSTGDEITVRLSVWVSVKSVKLTKLPLRRCRSPLTQIAQSFFSPTESSLSRNKSWRRESPADICWGDSKALGGRNTRRRFSFFHLRRPKVKLVCLL